MFLFTPLLGAQSDSQACQSLLELENGIKVLIDVGWDESFDVKMLAELERLVGRARTPQWIRENRSWIRGFSAAWDCADMRFRFADILLQSTSYFSLTLPLLTWELMRTRANTSRTSPPSLSTAHFRYPILAAYYYRISTCLHR